MIKGTAQGPVPFLFGHSMSPTPLQKQWPPIIFRFAFDKLLEDGAE
jgi:hypothetical protein